MKRLRRPRNDLRQFRRLAVLAIAAGWPKASAVTAEADPWAALRAAQPAPALTLLYDAQPFAAAAPLPAAHLGDVYPDSARGGSLTLRNDGATTVTLQGLQLAPAGNFRLLARLRAPVALAPGHSLTVPVAVFPGGAPGTISSQLMLTLAGPEPALQTARLTARARPLPTLALTDAGVPGQPLHDLLLHSSELEQESLVYLGGSHFGRAAPVRDVQLRNFGNQPLTLASLDTTTLDACQPVRLHHLLPPEPGEPRATIPLQLPLTLDPGETLDLRLDAATPEPGLHVSRFRFTTDAGSLEFLAAAARAADLCHLCPSDNAFWRAEDLSCAGVPDGALAGGTPGGLARLCVDGQSTLLGDANGDGRVDAHDLPAFLEHLPAAEPPRSLRFTPGTVQATPAEQARHFAALLADAAEPRRYNSRAATLRTNRFAESNPDSGYALGLAWEGHPYDFSSPDYSYVPQTKVCLDNLGTFDEFGQKVASHFKPELSAYVLRGKYVQTGPSWFAPDLGWASSAQSDFQFPFSGGPGLAPERAIGWASEVSAYFHVNRFRTEFVNEAFIKSLKLPPAIEDNFTKLQYRGDGLITPDGSEYLQRTPFVWLPEYGSGTNQVAHGRIYPFTNSFATGFRTKRWGGAELAPISHGFDPGFVVGEFAGLMAFWIHGTREPFLPDDVCMSSWKTNMTPCLNDGLNAWVAYRYTGQTEIFKTMNLNSRLWNQSNCDTNALGPCARGEDINNVMMFQEGNHTGDQIFPFLNSAPSAYSLKDAPFGADRSALFFAAIFYDLSKEAGLGDYKADQLFWKTLSLIDNVQALTMRQFAELVLRAGRELYPKSDGTGLYENLIAQVLASRGFPLYGAQTIYENLPAPIGDETRLLNFHPTAKFGSLHPDRQTAMAQGTYSYNSVNTMMNQYVASPDTDYQYMTYQLYKHSKYGPCDKLMFTDGSFSEVKGNGTFGQFNSDGTFYLELFGREPGNKVILVPGQVVRYNHYRARCANEMEAPFFLDVHPFGFKAIKEIKNGFSFTVQRAGEDAEYVTYILSIHDPSLEMTGPRTGPAEYDWSVRDFHGQLTLAHGPSLQISLPRDEPIELEITRTRGEYVDTLTLMERGNDLDREHGRAFLRDCLDVDENGNCR